MRRRPNHPQFIPASHSPSPAQHPASNWLGACLFCGGLWVSGCELQPTQSLECRPPVGRQASRHHVAPKQLPAPLDGDEESLRTSFYPIHSTHSLAFCANRSVDPTRDHIAHTIVCLHGYIDECSLSNSIAYIVDKKGQEDRFRNLE